MRSSLNAFIAIAAALLVVPSFASADDVGGGDDLQEVISRMSDLEQQLKATNDALAASTAKVDQQQKMLSKLGPSNQSGLALALSDFLTETTFGGWVSASYFYNTNNPNSGDSHDANQGFSRDGLGSAFHGDSNSFHVDEVWFEMQNKATPESRGGFQIDVLMGETADVLCDIDGDSNGSLPCLYNANVSYLAPITDAGIEITAGRFATHIGSERPGVAYNFNITRGLVWNLQPINYTGVKAASSYDMGLDWMLGFTNTSGYEGSGIAQQTDFDDEKVLLWHVGYEMSDTMAIAFNGQWGGNCVLSTCDATGGSNTDKQGIADMVFDWNPSDRLSTWVNTTWLWMEGENRGGESNDARALGIAVAGRYAVTDATGVALRGEFVKSWDDYVELGAGPRVKTNTDLWSITGTVDHSLTDHLTVKAEVVYQVCSSNDKFPNDTCFFDNDDDDLDNDQVLLGVQMTYQF
ncbi:MAG: outer membrane beta-barrel protein [Myxococcales bacterium]|nr:outer membrane beta-barrel protein [Myxococcales bacterium]